MTASRPYLGALPRALGLLPLLFVGLAEPAGAFSQIDPGETGSPAGREGIIAVPLPPLDDVPSPPPQTDDAPEPAPTDAAPTGGTPDPTAPTDESPTPPADDASAVPDAAGSAAEPQPAAGPAASPGDAASPGSDGSPAGDARTDPAARPAAAADGGVETPPDAAGAAADAASAAGAVEPVRYGEDGLPMPVRDLRRRLIEVARAGRIEALQPYLETGAEPTLLSFGETPADPIAFLKSISGDGEGAEILAILIEVLEAGHAHVEVGSDAEIFIWPYFAQADLERLTAPQKVELFELVTAGDFEAMKSFGAYNFYRAGISPEGRLEFFVAGD